MERNNYLSTWLALVSLAVLYLFVCAPASAYNFSVSAPYIYDRTTGGSCPGSRCAAVMTEVRNPTGHDLLTCPGSGLTRRIVPCIKDTILVATNIFIIPFSNYVANAVAACCVLAVILWGAHMVGGTETAPLKDAMLMALKIGFVIVFTTNFGNYYDNNGNLAGGSLDPNNNHGGNFGLVLDIMDEMLSVVTGYVINVSSFGLSGSCLSKFASGDTNNIYLVWDAVDCSVETLIGGIFSPFTLTAGITGFLVACLFSNTVGIAIGLAGLYLIYKLLFAIIKCVYIFLSAYVGIAFMVVISPFFIPAILFKSTKPFFDRWLKLFGGFIVQPMILFAYLVMLLAAFDVTVFTGNHSLYSSIAGHDPMFYVDTDHGGYGGQLGTWMLQEGFFTNEDIGGEAIAIDSKSVKAAGLIPSNVKNTGIPGAHLEFVPGYVQNQRDSVMNVLVNSGLFQVGADTQTIGWDHLAAANNYSNTTSYVLNVLVSAFMALLTGYIFVDILEILPFIGKGISLGGGITDSKGTSLGAGLDSNKLSTSGSNFSKNLKFAAGAKGL